MKYPQLVSMPSAVSDWLEEQLEARGIDAVVYTRYVLSLLYRDPVDIICPDQDLHFTNPNKEVRRSGGGRKRFCRSSDYWGYADAEQLKRSAAVECLKSASDQKCGIESLVDELCEKLKEVTSDNTTKTSAADETANNNNTEQAKALVQDPAKRYYAAFPALSRNTSTSSPNIIALIPKWFGSPKKKAPRKQNRSVSYEDKLHLKIDSENMKSRSVGKQRFNYFSRSKKDMGYNRSFSKSIDRTDSEWDFYNNNANNIKAKRLIKDLKEKDELWDASEDDINMYDDLPVDIRDLLTSPTPQDVNLEIMNMANMRETGNKKFIQCGTNIISSIWSNDPTMDEDATMFENGYNMATSTKDFHYSSMPIDKSVWSLDVNIIKDNETNSFFDNFGIGDEWGKLTKWSETDDYVDNVVTNSLLKLNHNKEESSFIEVKPRLSKIGASCKNMFLQGSNKKESNKRMKYEHDREKDDLLHSVKSHFRPINERLENRNNGSYVDGTTFVIPNGLDQVNFKRSDSGTMYLDADYGALKKYYEYKKVNDGFSLKFTIVQNDKACQTDSVKDGDIKIKTIGEESEFYFPGDQELLECEEKAMNCTCTNNNEFDEETITCAVHLTRPDSMMAEIFGKFELKCDKCNNNTSVWSKGWAQTETTNYDKQSLRNIWSGGEVCMACLGLSGRPPPSHDQNQLREDITQDGEQLLSDLSILQKSYMEEIPIAEVSCNLNDLIEARDWKSVVPIHSASFSFATRLQQECLIKMATIPTLRSITL